MEQVYGGFRRITSGTVPDLSFQFAGECIEKALVTGFFLYLCTNVWPEVDEDSLCNLILLLCEGLAVGLVLLHRPADKLSTDWRAWGLALSASFLPVLIAPMPDASAVPQALAVGLMIAGFLLQLTGKIYIGRSFGIVAANRGVCTRGPYTIIRHPIYAGYLLGHIGFLAAYPAIWNFTLYGIANTLQFWRLLAEEAVLSKDPAYETYKADVRWRVLPGVF